MADGKVLDLPKENAEELTELEKDILREALENPDQSHAEIASKLDCSASYVRQTRNTYEDHTELVSENTNNTLLIIGLILLALLTVLYNMGVI